MDRQVNARRAVSDIFKVRIEQQQEPYPWPLQQHAWLGVHFFQPAETQDTHLWFLKFALDERGLLRSSVAPSTSWTRWSRPWVTKLTGELDEEAQRLGRQPPHLPSGRGQMASLHAKLARQLGRPFQPTTRRSATYLAAPGEGWQHLGLQGFADLAGGCRMSATLAWCARRCQSSRRHRSTPVPAWRTRPPPALPARCWSASARSRSAPSPMPRPWPICAGPWPPARATGCAATSC